VESVRFGDRPIGNPDTTDQSPAATELAGSLEDIDAGPVAAAVQPALGGDDHEPDLDGSDANGPDQDDADADRDADQPGEDSPGQALDAPRTAPQDLIPNPRRRGSRHRMGTLPGGSWLRAGLAIVPRPRVRAGRQAWYAAAAKAGFARLTVLPTILVTAWLLVGLPLLLVGAFLPVPMLLIAVPVAVALAAGLHRVPAAWPREVPGLAAAPGAGRAADSPPGRPPAGPALWGLAGTVAVAAGFALWQFLFNSESVIVLGDPGTYLQTGYWIAQHGSLPIPQSAASFGGAHPGIGFSSIGFFARGTAVVPGLMSGLPLLLAGAFWVHGTSAAAAMGPILGGLGVLAFGGLVGRLAGPRWAPAGALVLAFTLPEQYTSRASFSETAAQVLLFGGLSLIADALTSARSRAEPGSEPGPPEAAPVTDPAGGRSNWKRWLMPRPRASWHTPEWTLMALGGLALGLAAMVRFDGLLDVLPAIPFAGILLVRRAPAAVAFCIGVGIGAAYGLADAYLLARPFVDSLQPMPELIALIAAWLAALTLAGVELLRLPDFRHGLRALLARRPVRWLPDLGGALALAALIGLVIRPYLQTVRGASSGAAADYVAALQRLGHLPVDPGRLYAEDTLYWVIWYVGVPAVLLGGFGVALLARRCLRALFCGRDPSGAARVWALPLAVICAGSAAVLWQPETVPDQPWASRRLVPLVIPGLILCAVWASAWLRGWARSRGAGRAAASVVAGCCVAALLVPTAVTTFGLGLTRASGGGNPRPTADGLAFKRVGQGEVGAVDRLCSSLGPTASVVIVDRPVAEQFTQVIRGMCGVPVAWLTGQRAGSVQTVLTGIERAGRRPVLLGSRPSELKPYGGSPVRLLNLSTTQDPHTLTQPPTTPSPASYVIWMTDPAAYGARV